MTRTRTSRFALGFGSAALAGGLLVGCGSSSSHNSATGAGTSPSTAGSSGAGSSGSASGTHFTVGLASEGLESPFPVAIANGMKKVASADGVKLIVLDGKETVSTQEANVQDLIAQHVSGILIDVINPQSTVHMVQQADAAHIPVMLVHGYAGSTASPVHPGVAFQIDENETGAGAQAGDMALKADPQGGQVGIVTGTPGYSAVTDRKNGFTSKLTSKYSVVATQAGNWTSQGGYSACQNIFQSHPKLALVYTESDDMALGCARAEASTSVKAPIVSIGGESQIKPLITSGKVYGTVCYEPLTEGETAMKTMVQQLQGKIHDNQTLDFYSTPTITKSNMNDCGWQW